MNLRNVTLAAAVATAMLGLAPKATLAADEQYGQLKWFGSIYAKFLDGDRRYENALYNNAEGQTNDSGGDQGQGIELELMLSSQVSKQVEIGARIHSRFNQNFWANNGGFGPANPSTGYLGEEDPRVNQYIKLRGAWARITPGYDWIDSATIGNSDWGMFDPFTQGKVRYIDRDNLAGFLFQGSAVDKTLRWDLARVTLSRQYQGPQFNTGKLFANDANYVGQLKYTPNPDWNATLIAMYARDKELDENDTNALNGTGVDSRYTNQIYGIRGQYSGLGWLDLKGSFYYSDFDIDESVCNLEPNDPGPPNGCRFSPTLMRDADDYAFTVDLNFNELFIDGLSMGVQFFRIGSDYQSTTAARRESDVLLTEGLEGTWQWGTPNYNFGNRGGAAKGGLGWGAYDGKMEQVVGSADNDFTDFDEPVAFQVQGWEGITLVPKLVLGDWEFVGEYSYIDFSTNWQACGLRNAAGEPDKTGCIYPRMEGTHAWGYGGDYRSPYAPYQDREMQIFALKAMYTVDFGNGVDLMARYKYISDEDDRVNSQAGLVDAYPSYKQTNPDWIPNMALGGCVGCDNRRADYDTYGFSAGYQLHPDLYAKLIYEYFTVELIDGTIDVAPVSCGDECAPAGWAEYLTGKTDKNRVGLNFSYFLSGVEFGGTFDYLWGTYDPSFFTDLDGRRVKLIPAAGVTAVPTVVGNIPIGDTNYSQYRMKVFMKVSF
jgi:hypothetical protein